jgi:zinc D-Ala-D-Ala carboxypeptidase
MDWSKYPNFTEKEFACSHCGESKMNEAFVARLQSLRSHYGKSMTISSGYRCPEHPIEKKKAKPGTHASGHAADIKVSQGAALELLTMAVRSGAFTGIGIAQKGPQSSRFLHLDDKPMGPTRPTIWSY